MDLRSDTVIRLAGHRLDLHARRLQRDDGAEVPLRPQVLELLCELARHAGEVVGKRELLDRVWPGMVVGDDSLVQAVGDLRRALGDERHAVVQTVPRRGYRLIVSPPADDAAPEPEADAASRPAARRWRPMAAIVAGVLVAAATLAAWRPWQFGADDARALAPDRPPIAVLGFAEPGASAEDQQLGRAYAEELVGELSRNADLRVLSSWSSLAVDADAAPTELAARLHVGYLVTGTVRREGEQLRLLVGLVDGRDGRVVWTERQSLDAAHVYAARDAIVQRIAGSLQSTMRGHEEALSLQRPPASLDVYTMTLRAIALKHRLDPEGIAQARALLERVVELDPQYAPGWSYLGMVDGIDFVNALTGPRRPEMLQRAVERIEHAIALDLRLSSTWLGLSFVYPAARRHDDGVRAGRRCVELAPSDAECRLFLALALSVTGQVDEAQALADEAMAMNPLAPGYARGFHGFALWGAGRIAPALDALDACIRMNPAYTACRRWRLVARAEAGRLDEAVDDLQQLRRQLPPGVALDPLFTGSYAPRADALVARIRTALQAVQAREAAAR